MHIKRVLFISHILKSLFEIALKSGALKLIHYGVFKRLHFQLVSLQRPSSKPV